MSGNNGLITNKWRRNWLPWGFGGRKGDTALFDVPKIKKKGSFDSKPIWV